MGSFFKSLFSGKSEESEEDKVKNDKKNFDIFKYDGLRAQKIGQINYAIRCYNEALKLEEDFEVLNYLVSAYMAKGDLEEALPVVNRMVELEPAHIQTLLTRANLNFMLENYEPVLADCSYITEIDAEIHPAYFLRAKAKKASGDLLGAIVDLTKTIALKEDFPDAYLLRGEILFSMAQFDEAAENAEKVISLSPEDESAFLLKGKIHEATGKTEEAKVAYQQVLDLNPFNEQAYLQLGQLYINQNELDQAISFFDEAIEIKADFVQAYHERGRAKYLKGDKKGAAEDMKKTLELDPEGDMAKKLEGQLKNFDTMYQGGIY